MKKLLLGALLLSSLSANSMVLHKVNNDYGVPVFLGMTELCEGFFISSDGQMQMDYEETINIQNGCTAFVTTTSLPTLIVENPEVTIDAPETMSALVNGDVDMANLVALHFDTTGTKILETVSVLDEAGAEITLENIGNNL